MYLVYIMIYYVSNVYCIHHAISYFSTSGKLTRSKAM